LLKKIEIFGRPITQI